MQWTVWWYETDSLAGTVIKVSEDFATLREASDFQDMLMTPSQIDRIEDCPWHHAHDAVLSKTMRDWNGVTE